MIRWFGNMCAIVWVCVCVSVLSNLLSFCTFDIQLLSLFVCWQSSFRLFLSSIFLFLLFTFWSKKRPPEKTRILEQGTVYKCIVNVDAFFLTRSYSLQWRLNIFLHAFFHHLIWLSFDSFCVFIFVLLLFILSHNSYYIIYVYLLYCTFQSIIKNSFT